MKNIKYLEQKITLTNNKKFDESTRLKLSYTILKSTERYREFQPCFKRYLVNHMRSRFVLIKPEEWQMALFLPSHRFQKASAQKVWSDSRKLIKG